MATDALRRVLQADSTNDRVLQVQFDCHQRKHVRRLHASEFLGIAQRPAFSCSALEQLDDALSVRVCVSGRHRFVSLRPQPQQRVAVVVHKVLEALYQLNYLVLGVLAFGHLGVSSVLVCHAALKPSGRLCLMGGWGHRERESSRNAGDVVAHGRGLLARYCTAVHFARCRCCRGRLRGR